MTAAGAAATPQPVAAMGQRQDQDHQAMPSDLTLRVKSLESLLVDKGLVDRPALDAVIDTMEHKVGPQNGARVIARAWVDPAYKRRLLDDAPAAIAELGFSSGQGEHMVVVENTPAVHNLIVCTLVLLLSLAGPGSAAGLVQVLGVPVARGHRSARPAGRVRHAPAGRHRGPRLGQHRGTPLHRAARASGRHRADERGGTGCARHARRDGRHHPRGAAGVGRPSMNGVHDMGGQHGLGAGALRTGRAGLP